MKTTHQKLGKYSRVADHLYRYSVTKKYYAVIKVAGKTKWIPLHTIDREIAGRNLKVEIAKLKNTDPQKSKMTLEALLGLYEKSIQGLAEHTQATRKSILKSFKETWAHGLEIQISAVTTGHLQIWLSQHQGRLKNSSYNEYLRFLRHLFSIAISRGRVNIPCISSSNPTFGCQLVDLGNRINSLILPNDGVVARATSS